MKPAEEQKPLARSSQAVALVLAAVVGVFAMKATQPIVVVLPKQEKEAKPVFYVKDVDGLKFWVEIPRHDDEGLVEWKARALAEIAAAGWTVINFPG